MLNYASPSRFNPVGLHFFPRCRELDPRNFVRAGTGLDSPAINSKIPRPLRFRRYLRFSLSWLGHGARLDSRTSSSRKSRIHGSVISVFFHSEGWEGGRGKKSGCSTMKERRREKLERKLIGTAFEAFDENLLTMIDIGPSEIPRKSTRSLIRGASVGKFFYSRSIKGEVGLLELNFTGVGGNSTTLDKVFDRRVKSAWCYDARVVTRCRFDVCISKPFHAR